MSSGKIRGLRKRRLEAGIDGEEGGFRAKDKGVCTNRVLQTAMRWYMKYM